jgi:hypothetical protein
VDFSNNKDDDKEDEEDREGIFTTTETTLEENPFKESKTFTQQSNWFPFEEDPKGSIESTKVNSDCLLNVFLPFDK